MSDGVALSSTAHPKGPWYKTLWFHMWTRWRAPTLSPGSLETIEIEIPVMRGGQLQGHMRGLWSVNASRINMSDNSFRNMGLQRGEWEDKVSDNEIEQDIQSKGLTAPRVTLERINSVIAMEVYTTGDKLLDISAPILCQPGYTGYTQALSCLTLCVLVLKNGFKVVGDSSSVSLENFDAELGRKIARQKAIDKVWMLEGYLLKEKLHHEAVEHTQGPSRSKEGY